MCTREAINLNLLFNVGQVVFEISKQNYFFKGEEYFFIKVFIISSFLRLMNFNFKLNENWIKKIIGKDLIF